jgi:hypothetical protein
VTDQEGKAILRRWPDTTALFRWKNDVKVLRAHPPSPLAQLSTFGVNSRKTYSDGAYVNLKLRDDSNAVTFVDVLFIEICGSLANLGDKRSRYLPTHETRGITFTREWFKKEIRWAGGATRPIWYYLGMSSIPEEDVHAPIRALRVLYTVTDQTFQQIQDGEVPRGHEFFATDQWLRSTVPAWPDEEPTVGWTAYDHPDSAFPRGSEVRAQARRFFDLHQHFLA